MKTKFRLARPQGMSTGFFVALSILASALFLCLLAGLWWLSTWITFMAWNKSVAPLAGLKQIDMWTAFWLNVAISVIGRIFNKKK